MSNERHIMGAGHDTYQPHYTLKNDNGYLEQVFRKTVKRFGGESRESIIKNSVILSKRWL